MPDVARRVVFRQTLVLVVIRDIQAKTAHPLRMHRTHHNPTPSTTRRRIRGLEDGPNFALWATSAMWATTLVMRLVRHSLTE